VECSTYILAEIFISAGTQSSEKHQEHNNRDEKKEHKDVSNNNVISFDWYRIGFVVSKQDLNNASACSYLDIMYINTYLVISEKGMYFARKVFDRVAISRRHMVRGIRAI